jgi:hypothetical protein
MISSAVFFHIKAEHHRSLRRVKVEADDVNQLLLEVGIIRDLESFDLPRLETVIPPDLGAVEPFGVPLREPLVVA